MSEEQRHQDAGAWARFKAGWRGTDDLGVLEARRREDEARSAARREQREAQAAERSRVAAEAAAEAERERQRIKTPEERAAALDEAIANHVRWGWRVESRAEWSAQLVKPKRFSSGSALLWFLLGFVTLGLTWLILIIQIIGYAGKSGGSKYLTVDSRGNVSGQRSWL